MNWKYWASGFLLLIVLGIAYYGLSPLFINIELNEELPQGTSQSEMSPSAEVVGTTGHPASGTARVIRDGENTYLRYENFKTINGPDLFVYLATDKDATEFINLGALKATEGNVNYEIPAGTDLSKYKYALIWCRAFGVLFNSAKLPDF